MYLNQPWLEIVVDHDVVTVQLETVLVVHHRLQSNSQVNKPLHATRISTKLFIPDLTQLRLHVIGLMPCAQVHLCRCHKLQVFSAIDGPAFTRFQIFQRDRGFTHYRARAFIRYRVYVPSSTLYVIGHERSYIIRSSYTIRRSHIIRRSNVIRPSYFVKHEHFYVIERVCVVMHRLSEQVHPQKPIMHALFCYASSTQESTR